MAKVKAAATILVIGGGTMAVSMKAGGVGVSEPATVPATTSTKGVSESAPPVPSSVPASEAVSPMDHSKRALWSTVRIKVHEAGKIAAFGSGTVVSSTPDESIILTAGQILSTAGRTGTKPSEFTSQVEVELIEEFLESKDPAILSKAMSFFGSGIVYDRGRDLALVRIHPGRKLPVSPIVPTDWKAEKGVKLLSVGCPKWGSPEATVTKVVTPRLRGLLGRMDYEGIECESAPDPGRFGGGLFTDDGYLAGVCNFADEMRNYGIYAAPASIHAFLDRNGLKALYAPKTPAQDSIPPKTPDSSFDVWLRETEGDLGSERTVKTLKSRFDEMVNEESHLAEQLQQVQRKRIQVGRLLFVAEKIKKDKAPFQSPIKSPSATDPNRPLDLPPDQPEGKKPNSPDVEARLKDVERKLDSLLRYLEEKAKAAAADASRPPPPPAPPVPLPSF